MLLSDIFALAAAICLATSGMFIHELNGRVGVLRLGRWQMMTAFLMTGTVSLLLGGWRTVAPWEVGFLAASSLCGIIIASTAYYAAIFAAGPRVTALMFSLTSPIALVLGYLAFGETISPRQGSGVVLVLIGIGLAIGLPTARAKALPGSPLSATRVPWLGIGFGLILGIGQALGSLFARPAMAAGVEPFTAMAIRAGVAGVFFFALALLPVRRLRDDYVFSARLLGVGITASLIGTGLGMSLLMAALVKGSVGIVSTLSSMTPVVILPMVWFRSSRAPHRNAWIGAILAVCGTALISL